MKNNNRNDADYNEAIVICDDCGTEFEKSEIETCPTCGENLCQFCLELHADEHFFS